jgi:hypothetical protein
VRDVIFVVVVVAFFAAAVLVVRACELVVGAASSLEEPSER